MINVNLVEDTLRVIEEHGANVEDILYVGLTNAAAACSWRQFVRMASEVEYFNDHLSPQTVRDELMIVGRGWVLIRWGYDGTEGWNFIRLMKPNANMKLLTRDDFLYDRRR